MNSLYVNRHPDKIKSYQYYDKPDGEDCLKKMWFMIKKASLIGVGVSSCDVLLYSNTKGYGPIIARFAYFTFPIIGMGAAYSATSCAAASFRKKDDHLNYALAGIASAGVWGAWRRSLKVGIYGGFVFALFSAVYKDLHDHDWIHSSPPRAYTDPFRVHQDWSIASDPGRTWKKSLDE